MLNLEGQIAVLKQKGKQIAGLYDWESHVILNITTVEGMKQYKPTKKINALSYWLIEPVKDNLFEAEFYQIFMNDLILIDAGKVVIEFPDCRTIDRRLYAPLEIRWVSDFEH